VYSCQNWKLNRTDKRTIEIPRWICWEA